MLNLGLPLILKLAGGAALVAILSLTILWQAADRRADKWQSQSLKCSAARIADHNAYTAAQREAAEKNREQVARIESEQERITNEVASNLAARLERLRRELRGQAAAPGGASGSPGASPDGQAPGGADEAPGVCIPTDQYVLGGEYEEKLDQWINWYEQQSRVVR